MAVGECQVGYGTVAINYTLPIENSESTKKEKKKKQVHEINVQAEDLKLSKEQLEKLQIPPTFRQLTRLSTENFDVNHLKKVKDLQHFDLIAVKPTDDKSFHQACGSLDIDIIIINVTERLPYMVKRPSIRWALEKGIHFEIIYSPSIIDRSLRIQGIGNAQSLMSICKGKNIIISSGCKRAIELRSPYDVANLGLLFGLTEIQAKDAVTKNCRALLKHAEARRMGRGAITAHSITVRDYWLKRGCTVEVVEDKEKDDEPTAKKKKISNVN